MMVKPRLLVALLAALALATSLAACGADTAPPAGGAAPSGEGKLAGAVREPALEVAAIALPNVADGGKPMSMKAASGELLLVYFGYTSCPDVCPTTLSDTSVALNDLPDDLAKRIKVAMVTVDPERDSAEILTGYLAHFFDRTAALRTDDPAELLRATEAFGVQFEVEQHDPETTAPYAVSHSAITYVVDDTGRVVVEWPFGFESTDMTADLTKLLS